MMLLVLHGPKLEVIACLILSSITLVLVFTCGTLEMALHWLTLSWAFAVDIIASTLNLIFLLGYFLVAEQLLA